MPIFSQLPKTTAVSKSSISQGFFVSQRSILPCIRACNMRATASAIGVFYRFAARFWKPNVEFTPPIPRATVFKAESRRVSMVALQCRLKLIGVRDGKRPNNGKKQFRSFGIPLRRIRRGGWYCEIRELGEAGFSLLGKSIGHRR